ncbi:helix-turn-helix transcriptional regulator [Cellulosimicrobium cellulans]|uniref:helix-turn-helix transcriptional regulator n=1 Tax=Cellulosimicrobium cellulans TaxID=1710 RepID=UPI0024049D5E|nr:LuxR C-terminal-related transcriptional regulator [Cellulosimicrobium cellulans]MDF9877564.1 LuxR family maltose regulon positive regulatory protein [Cellulosimicrobium cellulans]
MSDAFWSADEPDTPVSATAVLMSEAAAGRPGTAVDTATDVLRQAGTLLPPARGTVHPRRGVEQALAAGPPLTTVHVPRGFGATTAVSTWARGEIRRGTPVLWISARTSTGGRPQRGTPTEALTTWVDDALAYLVGQRGSRRTPPAPEAVADRLDESGVTLVLDDVGPATRGLLDAVAEVAPRLGRARAVVVTTARPSGGDGALLTLDDLAVTPDEVAESAKLVGTDLEAGLAELLTDQLAGWATGVYGAVTTLAGAVARGEETTEDLVLAVARRYRARALQDLPRDVTELLLDLSVAEEFDEPDLALLTSVPRPLAHLELLHDAGAVVRTSGRTGTVFAIRPRLRRALVDVARHRHPARFQARALGAAAERLDRGETRMALRLELEAGDTTQAARTLARSWTTLLDGSDDHAVEALWSAVGSVPRTHLPPRLLPLLAAVRSPRGGLGSTVADASVPTSGARPETDELGAFLSTVSLRRSGRREDAIAVARALLVPPAVVGPPELHAEDQPRSAPATLALLALQSSLAAIELGRPVTASRFAQRAHQEALGGGLLRLASAGAGLAALAEALGDDVREAHAWLHEASALPDPPRWWRTVAGDTSALVTALEALASRDPESARLVTSSDAVEKSAGTDLWAVGLHVEAAAGVLSARPEPAVDHVRTSLMRRGLVRGPEDGREGRSAPALELAPPLVTAALGRLYLALGRGTTAAAAEAALPGTSALRTLLAAHVAIARGDEESALHGVASLTSNDALPVGQRAEAHVVVAEALRRGGDRDGARIELARAASFARRHGSLLPFRWFSPPSLDALVEVADDLTRELLAPLRRDTTTAEVCFVHLPERQLLVLQALAEGLTGPEIARAFFVSRNTVKTQVREIYRRLGVHDKASAVRRAHDLGLLDPLNRAPGRDR